MPEMTAMVLTAERRLVLERRPVPTPRADQVLVDVELCGICGSDLHCAPPAGLCTCAASPAIRTRPAR
jgi:D-arabinose 1-dehydrogenase-like Zn-dependent alcohol dehydrogenase